MAGAVAQLVTDAAAAVGATLRSSEMLEPLTDWALESGSEEATFVGSAAGAGPPPAKFILETLLARSIIARA